MNKRRRAIFDKTGGRCFYCGAALGEKGWHEDHFHPIIRGSMRVATSDEERRRTGLSHKLVHDGSCDRPHLDCNANKVPSCAPCNNFKSNHSIEGFRTEVAKQQERTLKNSTGLRQLLRLGLVSFSDEPVVFWFEQQGIAPPDELAIMGIRPDAAAVQWNYDKVEECHCAMLGEYALTARKGTREWQFTLTHCSTWEQTRKSASLPADKALLFGASFGLDTVEGLQRLKSEHQATEAH